MTVPSLQLSLPPLTSEQLRVAVQHLTAAKHFINASFVVLIYDHILTFPVEVERIWKRRFTGATFLFLLNRYLAPAQFIVNLVSFNDGSWSDETCLRFVMFPGACTVVSIAIIEIILILRTYALYRCNKFILVFLSALWVAQVVIMGYVLSKGQRLPLPPGLVGCILTGEGGPITSVFWTAPLVMDTIIFVLTLWKTWKYAQGHVKTPLLYVLLRDGIVYFSVIFCVNLLNVLIYLLSPLDLKAIGASFSQIMTTVMISHLVLNLRDAALHDDSNIPHPEPAVGTKLPPSSFQRPSVTMDATSKTVALTTPSRILGNLGAPLHISQFFSDYSDSYEENEDGGTGQSGDEEFVMNQIEIVTVPVQVPLLDIATRSRRSLVLDETVHVSPAMRDGSEDGRPILV